MTIINSAGAFAVASVLTFLALITIALKVWVEYKSDVLRGTAYAPMPVGKRPAKNFA